MLEEIEAFKANLLARGADACICFMEAVADFSDETAGDFEREFPLLNPMLYQRTKIWHSLIGSTLPEDYAEQTSEEVYEWLAERIKNFLDSYFDTNTKAVA